MSIHGMVYDILNALVCWVLFFILTYGASWEFTLASISCRNMELSILKPVPMIIFSMKWIQMGLIHCHSLENHLTCLIRGWEYIQVILFFFHLSCKKEVKLATILLCILLISIFRGANRNQDGHSWVYL